ncbi:MAG: hypothetical protein KDK66_03515 [Deltaproteobacteria bacterium]|nr:hypothetical protein [Deltaproteobacteria bacterium]
MDNTLKVKEFEGKSLEFFRTTLKNGRTGYGAAIKWSKEEKILLDHWNLGALKRQVSEWFPVMQMARECR